jgi:putative acetyltransferase
MPAPLAPPIPVPPLRPALDADGPGLAALIAACFAEYEGCLYVPAEFPELAAPAAHYASRGAELWVMEAGEDVGEDAGQGIIGSVAITPAPTLGACEITKVYLDARWRGGGAGEALIAHATARASALGLPDLVLWTDTRFSRAHRFYEKHGFLRRPVVRYLADASRSWEYRYERRGARALPELPRA